MSSAAVQRNEQFLRSFETGGILLDGYDLAREADPRLDNLEIVAVTQKHMHSLAQAAPKWASSVQSGLHQVRLRPGTFQELSDYCSGYVERDPTAAAIMSERMGIRPDELTAPLLYVFTELHEFGHVGQFFDYEHDPQALENAVQTEHLSLPVMYGPPSSIATEGSGARQIVDRQWNDISARLGVTSIAELVEVQARAYRNLPTEANADHFAVEVLQDNPSFMDLLLSV